jgi:glycosyltransferase involved in cell wall biosynthesis/O-antigen/teichoic acid export membrane protein
MGALLSAITDGGSASLLIREGAREPRDLGRLLAAMTLWRIIALPIAGLVLWFVISATISTRPLAVFLVALGLAVQQFAELTRAVFIARQEMHVSSIHGAVENVSWLLLTVALLASGQSLEFAFAGGVVVFATSTVFGAVLNRMRGLRGVALPPGADLLRLLRAAAPFAAFMVVGVAYSRVDALMIGALIPTGALVAAGAYVSATRLLAGFEYIPEAVSRASFPRLATAFIDGSDRLTAELRPDVTFLLILGIPIPFAMAVGGSWLMTTVFGAETASYAWLVVPLSAVIPFRFLAHLFGMTLTSSDSQGRRVYAVVAALALVLVVDLLLVPRIGVAGAVVGSIVASTVVFGVYVSQVMHHVGSFRVAGLVLRCLSLAAVLTAVALVIRPTVGPAAAAGLLLAAYLVCLLATGDIRVPRGSLVRSSAAPPVRRRAILFLHPADEAYGADRVLLQAVEAVLDAGWKARVLLPDDQPPGWLSAQLDDLGVEVSRGPLAVARRRYFGPRGWLRYASQLFRARRHVRRIAEEWEPSVVHVNTAALLVGAMIGRPRGARLVWHVHEIVVRPRGLASLFRIAPALTADRVIAISDAVQRWVSVVPWRRFRVVRVYNGVVAGAPPPRMQLSTSGLVVAFVGRLNRWKGAEILVEAAALIKANGILAKVIIAGDAPAGEESRVGDLQDRIERAALEEQVEVIGFCDDVPALLATVDVVVVPSLWPEPFGLVTAEAMRAGRVVVASRHGAATELLDGGSSGVLVPPGDVPALAAALKRLAQDPELRQRLGAAARRRIETVFTRERFVADLLALYESVAE